MIYGNFNDWTFQDESGGRYRTGALRPAVAQTAPEKDLHVIHMSSSGDITWWLNGTVIYTDTQTVGGVWSVAFTNYNANTSVDYKFKLLESVATLNDALDALLLNAPEKIAEIEATGNSTDSDIKLRRYESGVLTEYGLNDLGGGGLTPVFIDDDYTASAGEKIYVDSSVKAIEVTLPAGSDADNIVVKDDGHSASINPITITPNGAETIDGDTSIVIDQSEGWCDAAYKTADTNWRVALSGVPNLMFAQQEVCLLTQTTGQSIANASFGSNYLKLSFDAAEGTKSNWWDSTGKKKITVEENGLYLVTASVTYVGGNSSATDALIGIQKNNDDTDATGILREIRVHNSYGKSLTVTSVISLSASDFIELYVYQVSGSALTTDPVQTSMSLTRLT
jgi:hypothetical protein